MASAVRAKMDNTEDVSLKRKRVADDQGGSELKIARISAPAHQVSPELLRLYYGILARIFLSLWFAFTRYFCRFFRSLIPYFHIFPLAQHG